MGCQEGKPQLRFRILEAGDRLLYWCLCSVTCLQKHSAVLLDPADSREPYPGSASAFLLPFLTSPYSFRDPFGSH